MRALLLGVSWLLVLVGWVAGCAGTAFLAGTVTQEKIKARYELPEGPTLVLVDDPGRRLGGPMSAAAVASRIGFDLTEHKAVRRENLIDQARLATLSVELAEAYPTTPIDQIGRSLGANTVIYVYVESASYQQEPGLVRPTASVLVKVIEARTGQRLFPTEAHVPAGGAQVVDHGWPIRVNTPMMNLGRDIPSNSALAISQMADVIGREVAMLFYDHEPARPAS
ncbi:MAG: hypothetical protein IT442_02655 [Phycisphaeraceae bacterium]|nr:hypothetical protein [Phycisphaeraceae bacterium]